MFNGDADVDGDDDNLSTSGSVEGRIARNLFRTDSDSISSDVEENNDDDCDICLHEPLTQKQQQQKQQRQADHEITESNNNYYTDQQQQLRREVDGQQEISNRNINNKKNTRRRRKIMNVLLEEEIVGGSIAHRVWPAGEYLALYILDFVRNNNNNNNSKNDGLTNNNYCGDLHSSQDSKDNYLRQASDADCNNSNNQMGMKMRDINSGQTDPNDIEKGKNERNNKKEIRTVLDDLRNILIRPYYSSNNDFMVSQPSNESTKDIEVKKRNKTIRILEIGAGTGFTGLELVSQLPSQFFSRLPPQLSTNNTNTDNDNTIAVKPPKSTQLSESGVNVQVLLTDLEIALPLLNRNIELNIPTTTSNRCNKIHSGTFNQNDSDGGDGDDNSCGATVYAQKLDWSSKEDCHAALDWFRTSWIKCATENKHRNAADPSSHPENQKDHNSTRNEDDVQDTPLLIIGSDCVYWDCLHEPLEQCLYNLLSKAPSGSVCLLAGMRRWKRDTAFYNRLNRNYNKEQRKASKRNRKSNNTHHRRSNNKDDKNTNSGIHMPLLELNNNASSTGYLVCTCLDEKVTRQSIENHNQEQQEQQQGGREIMRIYAVRYHRKQSAY